MIPETYATMSDRRGWVVRQGRDRWMKESGDAGLFHPSIDSRHIVFL
jgi:hypothetical protein